MNAASKKILIADDDSSIRLVLSQAFTRLGYQVRATGNATTLLKWVTDGEGDLVVTDVMMPDENVFDVLPRIRKERPKLPIIVMSAQNTLLTAVNAADAGAFEYISKPFDLDDVTAAARRALSRPADAEASKAQARAMRDERLPLIGRSAPMQEVYRTIARLVGADLTVLILGESGTGKELVARALHELGRRRDGKFVVINLAAVPRERVETELFGRGEGDLGRLIEADGGTLFLDEIGDMPLDAQTRLLRVIDGTEPVLNPKTGRRPNVRIIAATNRDLRGLIQQGLFREDLFFRLNVAPVRLPPLRDRAEDIPDLARTFLLRANREGLPAKTIDSSALDRLKVHSWPGNVRELENLIRRMCALYAEELITARIVDRELQDHTPAVRSDEGPVTLSMLVERHLAAHFADQPDGVPAAGLYDRVLQEVERPLIQLTLSATRGNQVRAAEILGLNRNTLRKKIQDLGVEMTRGRR
ncbi:MULTISPECIES: sigma 54-interacting transcriptional regulator [unclassified Caulobacter]|uniref:sigma 54-interacting transcriptional regulator n=1 Tax=unclassified Caulobacter TaxID=2648921 RepID=UPI000D3C77D3|nr:MULTISPECIES: sigma 54-interacting transcriptional regulator [unclassified Caulobacter]PTS91246.1 nitrogen regulation protein NR(I) [Caulobacter sp. HMWF009]PTT04492.1 nitrogen regulation protein NR(I) [Caulobacter sp. HMWF025]